MLLGNSEAVGGKKVLKTSYGENVFVYYSDHGNTGLIAMPSGGNVYADKLNEVLNKMHEKKKYRDLVFYLEACFSGSMFRNLLAEDHRIFATTAANHEESSYAQYCGSDARVQGVDIGTCLGDEYSVNWME